jgi:hypothetical protein
MKVVGVGMYNLQNPIFTCISDGEAVENFGACKEKNNNSAAVILTG